MTNIIETNDDGQKKLNPALLDEQTEDNVDGFDFTLENVSEMYDGPWGQYCFAEITDEFGETHDVLVSDSPKAPGRYYPESEWEDDWNGEFPEWADPETGLPHWRSEDDFEDFYTADEAGDESEKFSLLSKNLTDLFQETAEAGNLGEDHTILRFDDETEDGRSYRVINLSLTDELNRPDDVEDNDGSGPYERESYAQN